MNPAPNLFFVGPMGAGKTTIGRRVADMVGLPFLDLDHEIEQRTGAEVALIFELEGEDGFRRREQAHLAELAARHGVVVATGGGAVLDAQNRKILGERGFVVFLETSIEQQLQRLARDRKRPLLAAPDRRERLLRLAAERTPLYREVADLTVTASRSGSAAQLAQRIVELLAEQWQRSEVASPA